MEHYNVSKSVSNFVPKLQQSNLGHSSEGNMCDDHNTQMAGNRKVIFRSTPMGYLHVLWVVQPYTNLYVADGLFGGYISWCPQEREIG